jgi:hydroxyacylglutathione hydrolase
LKERVDELPKNKSLVVHCRSGYRSAIVASTLQQQGFEHVLDLVGGLDAWTASKLPVADAVATG